MYYLTIDNVQYSCDTLEELLAMAQQAHVLGNGSPAETTTVKRWSERNKPVKKKRGRKKSARRSSTRKSSTRQTVAAKKKPGTANATKRSWDEAKKRAKADGISPREARSKIAAEKANA